MKRYELDFFDDENGIKKFMEAKIKLLMYDIPRINKQFMKKLDDKNSQSTGIYLLINKNDEESINSIYVGESDNVFKRVSQHIQDNRKDFNRCIFIFSDSNHSKLNKDQIRFLEKKLILHFGDLKNWNNESNKEQGKTINVPFIEEKLLEEYFDFIIYGLKLFDYPVFYSYEKEIDSEIIKDEIEKNPNAQIEVWTKTLLNEKVEAKFIKTTGNNGQIFFDKECSFITKLKNNNETNLIHLRSVLLKNKREEKIDYDENKDIEKEEIRITIKENSSFSPSNISALTTGGVINGWIKWQDENGKKIISYRN